MQPFINIHSHRPAGTGEISILNCLATEKPPPSVFSVGMHPWYIREEVAQSQFQSVQEKAILPNCLAIGECGLDRLKGPPIEIQLHWLTKQAVLASDLKKPLIIHCVKAFDLLAAWLKKQKLTVPCIIHGYRKNTVILKQLRAFGCLFSFGYQGLHHSSSIKSFHQLDLQALLLETDDAPHSIATVYERASTLLNIEIKALQQIQIDNFQRLFNYDFS